MDSSNTAYLDLIIIQTLMKGRNLSADDFHLVLEIYEQIKHCKFVFKSCSDEGYTYKCLYCEDFFVIIYPDNVVKQLMYHIQPFTSMAPNLDSGGSNESVTSNELFHQLIPEQGSRDDFDVKINEFVRTDGRSFEAISIPVRNRAIKIIKCAQFENCLASVVILMGNSSYKVLHCDLIHIHPDDTFEKLRDAFNSIEIAAQMGKNAKNKGIQLFYFNWIKKVMNESKPS